MLSHLLSMHAVSELSRLRGEQKKKKENNGLKT